MSRHCPGSPGLSRYPSITFAIAIASALALPANAGDSSPVVAPAASSAAPTIAAPDAAPKVELPYKLLTKPAPGSYSASQPALSVEAAPPTPGPAATVAKAESATPAPAATILPAPAPAAMTPPAPAAAEKANVIAPPPKPAPPAITLNINIDLTRQKMTLIEYGKVVGSWPISSGAAGYRSPTGTFRPIWSSRMWYSKQYDNAPMPHAVFFNGGIAMHATQAVSRLGSPASHGCIRQSPANAAKTYNLVAKHGNSRVKIVVHGKPKYDEPRIARRDRNQDLTASARYAARETRVIRPSAGLRRVIIVDSYGNRRMAEIPANDPRLAAYHARQYYGGTYGGYNSYGNRW